MTRVQTKISGSLLPLYKITIPAAAPDYPVSFRTLISEEFAYVIVNVLIGKTKFNYQPSLMVHCVRVCFSPLKCRRRNRRIFTKQKMEVIP